MLFVGAARRGSAGGAEQQEPESRQERDTVAAKVEAGRSE